MWALCQYNFAWNSFLQYSFARWCECGGSLQTASPTNGCKAQGEDNEIFYIQVCSDISTS